MVDRLWGVVEKLAGWSLKLIFKVLKREPSGQDTAAFMQFVRFGAVGASNTLVSYLVYVGSLAGLHGLGIFREGDYLIAQLASFLLSVPWSFYWNRRKVFTRGKGEGGPAWKVLLRTYVAYSLTGLPLNGVLLLFWVRVLHLSKYLAPVLSLAISVPANFALNKYWAFK